MQTKTVMAGAGGQGVLSMGYCLAYAAMEEERHVTYMPAYGAEVRGGTANCTVVVSTEEIASPIASSPDNVVILNTPSLLRFENAGRSGGLYIINTTLVTRPFTRADVKVIEIPASDLAEATGGIRMTNMVLLGALIGATELVSLRTMNECVETIFGAKKKSAVETNRQALAAGYKFVTETLGKTTAGKIGAK